MFGCHLIIFCLYLFLSSWASWHFEHKALYMEIRPKKYIIPCIRTVAKVSYDSDSLVYRSTRVLAEIRIIGI